MSTSRCSDGMLRMHVRWALVGVPRSHSMAHGRKEFDASLSCVSSASMQQGFPGCQLGQAGYMQKTRQQQHHHSDMTWDSLRDSSHKSGLSVSAAHCTKQMPRSPDLRNAPAGLRYVRKRPRGKLQRPHRPQRSSIWSLLSISCHLGFSPVPSSRGNSNGRVRVSL